MISKERENKIREVYSKRQKDLVVVIENVWDPHNVSAVVRSCDAVGVDYVYLVYPDKNFPAFHNTVSSSAGKWVNANKFTSIKDCYKELHHDGFKIYTSYLGEGVKSKDLYDLKLDQKVALVFGNESDGVTKEAYENSDGNFLIPMVGMVQSLNISVAVAVSLFEAMRQRLEKNKYKKSQYTSKEIDDKVKEVAWEKINKKMKINN